MCGSSATHNSPGNRPSHHFKHHENPYHDKNDNHAKMSRDYNYPSGRPWPKTDVVPAAAASKASGGERLRRDSFLQLLFPCHPHSLLRSWTRGWWKTRAGSLQPGDSMIISRHSQFSVHPALLDHLRRLLRHGLPHLPCRQDHERHLSREHLGQRLPVEGGGEYIIYDK